MTGTKSIKAALVAGIFLTSAGGLTLHLLLHTPPEYPYGLVPMFAGIISTLAVPWLFCFRKTIHLAYLLNGVSALIGTVTMGHYSIVKSPLILFILILWAKFLMGYVLFHREMPVVDDPEIEAFKFIRYPHLGFWLVHLMTVSVVYALGALLWK